MIPVRRTDIRFTPNPSRVLFRPFVLSDEQRVLKIIARVMAMTEAEVRLEMDHVLAEFHGRHPRLTQFFLRRYAACQRLIPTDEEFSASRRLLLGAYFTMEYSLESAALFNPSLVWHPDQSGLPAGAKRFVVSLRAVGEGHISSITFRSGVIHLREVDVMTHFMGERFPRCGMP